jgi:hypothetical protein
MPALVNTRHPTAGQPTLERCPSKMGRARITSQNLDQDVIVTVIMESTCAGDCFEPSRPHIWDGLSAERIARVLERRYTDAFGHRPTDTEEAGP